MKRKDLERQLTQLAKQHNLPIQWTEGGEHSKVTIGTIKISIPRHREINELLARKILKQATKELNK